MRGERLDHLQFELSRRDLALLAYAWEWVLWFHEESFMLVLLHLRQPFTAFWCCFLYKPSEIRPKLCGQGALHRPLMASSRSHSVPPMLCRCASRHCLTTVCCYTCMQYEQIITVAGRLSFKITHVIRVLSGMKTQSYGLSVTDKTLIAGNLHSQLFQTLSCMFCVNRLLHHEPQTKTRETVMLIIDTQTTSTPLFYTNQRVQVSSQPATALLVGSKMQG